jgi:hypothetical protein
MTCLCLLFFQRMCGLRLVFALFDHGYFVANSREFRTIEDGLSARSVQLMFIANSVASCNYAYVHY